MRLDAEMSSYRLNHLHHDLERKLATDNTRFNNDLENWSKIHGPESETKWPVFEASVQLGCITVHENIFIS